MNYYYGYILDDFGFIEETDARKTDDFIFVTEEEHENLLKEQENGLEIVSYNGKIFAAVPDLYFVQGREWVKRTEQEYQEIIARREAERKAKLSLTKREVFLALYADKGITPEMLEAQITDPAALIEFKYAERYYRGNALIGLIGEKLGYTSEQLDTLFETGGF